MNPQTEAVKALMDTLPVDERAALLANYATAPAEKPRSLRLLRPVEAARLMGISTTTLWRLRKEGRIQGVEIRKGSERIPEAAIQDFIRGADQQEMAHAS